MLGKFILISCVLRVSFEVVYNAVQNSIVSIGTFQAKESQLYKLVECDVSSFLSKTLISFFAGGFCKLCFIV